mmetsp:Transcript_28857/g.60813  ORF Transcript_28857/g.60813 Transcript_28857/m.60813 type:complete len:321 (-) Transcript_28857:567-1529(-)
MNEDVGRMPVSQANHVPHHRARCNRPRVGEPLLEPVRGIQKVLEEEMVHDRLEVVANFHKDFLLCRRPGILVLVKVLEALLVGPVLRAEPPVGAPRIRGAARLPDQVLGQRNRLLHPLHEAGRRRQRNDVVSPHAELPLSSLCARLKQVVHQVEELLHHRVLAQVVVPRLGQLQVLLSVAVHRSHQLGGVDPSNKSDLVLEVAEVGKMPFPVLARLVHSHVLRDDGNVREVAQLPERSGQVGHPPLISALLHGKDSELDVSVGDLRELVQPGGRLRVLLLEFLDDGLGGNHFVRVHSVARVALGVSVCAILPQPRVAKGK